jgi:hypothetical protein
MPSRRADVFFYGLFMDEDVLRAQGVAPEEPRLAWVDGVALRIGKRATLVSMQPGRVHGLVMSLTAAELQHLYSQPGLESYKPQAVLAHLADGSVVAALCYNLVESTARCEAYPEYAMKLRAVARKVGLPEDYVAIGAASALL